MSVTCHSFGVTRRGEAVTAWQLSNHTGTSVTVLDYGATVQSLCVPDRAGRLTDVVLGYDTAAAYETNDGFLGATVGRMCNRIGGAAFSLNGKTYPLERNDGANHLHGGRRGVWIAGQVEGRGTGHVGTHGSGPDWHRVVCDAQPARRQAVS